MAVKGSQPMTAGLVAVLFVAAGLVAVGAFIAAWRRDLTVALGGVPLMFAGAGTAFAGVSRFAAAPARSGQLLGQEVAVLLAVAALAAVVLGVGLAGREGRR
jgi:NADH:ubiquinone oxidoreductase subunit K